MRGGRREGDGGGWPMENGGEGNDDATPKGGLLDGAGGDKGQEARCQRGEGNREWRQPMHLVVRDEQKRNRVTGSKREEG